MAGVYLLGAIPPLSVLKGDTLTVAIETKLGSGAAYSLSFEGAAPKGAMALNATTGALTFTPAPQDRTPIKAVLEAKKDGKSEQQTVAIVPLLPSDFTVIEHRSTDRTAPDPEGWQYLTVVEDAAQAKRVVFNNEAEYETGKEPAIETRQVIASGVRLVLERSEKYPLFKKLDGTKSYNGRTDLKRVTLCADEVVVRSRLELPGTDLTIYARKLIFEKDGQIVTTPRSVNLQATRRMEGHKGQDAGNIELYVEQLEMPGETVRMVASGGRGQAAKAGVAGDNGSNMGVWGGHSETPNHIGLGGTVGLNWPGDKDGYKPVYVEVGYYVHRTSRAGIKTKQWLEKDNRFGEKRWPSDGKEPKEKPGAPGQGGNGGAIHSQFRAQLEKTTERKAGEAGTKAADISAAKAGEPQKSCWVKAVYEETSWTENKVVGYDFFEQHTSKYGAEAKAGDPVPKEAPKAGELKYLDRTGAGYWLHPTVVRALVSYAHDSMLAGRPEDARDRLAHYDRALVEARKSGGALGDAAASSIEWPALHADVSALIERIDSPNDYFGNPPGWVPMLSFEANLKLYESQIGEAIRTMYVAYWIGNNQEKNEKARTTFERALSSLVEESEQAEKDSQDALKRLGQLEEKCSEIATSIEGLQRKRKYRVMELRKDAENQVRFEKVLRSSAELLGAVMQLVPVAQPALGAFGKGLTALSEFDPDKPSKIVPGLVGAFGDLAKEKLTAKLEPLFKNIKEAKTEQEQDESKPDEDEKDAEKAKEKEDIKKGVAKKKLAEKVKKVLDDEKAAKEQLLGAFSKFAASEDEIKERLQRLEAECPEFQELIKEIEKLNKSKAGFLAELTATLEILDQAAAVLLANQQGRIELRSQLDTTLNRLNPDAMQYIGGMGQRARQRLLKYQYYLLKSYQYLMFEDIPEIDFGVQKVFDEFAEILSPEGALSAEKFDKLRGIFDAQLQDIIEKIIDGYQGQAFGRENDFQVQLSKGQLQALNETKELTLDPLQMASLDLQRDKIRLMAIGTESVELSGFPDKNFSLSLAYEHDGISHLRAAGRLYEFRSGISSKNATRQRMFWETTVNYNSDPKAPVHLTWKESPVDQAAKSLLEYLLNKVGSKDADRKKTAETLLTYRPSPWAKITIRCQEIKSSYKIDKLVLRFSYVANLLDDKFTTVLVRMSRGVERRIYLDTYDQNRRSDGVGTFLRTFRRGTKITLEAPGEDFDGWQIGDQPKPKGPLELKLDNTAYIVKANFKRPAAPPPPAE